MTRRSNYNNSDPAVYPYLEIYPKIQSQVEVKSNDGGRGFKSYVHPGPKEVPKIQPWSFGWPSFRPVSPPASTSLSAPTLVSSPPLKSVMAYPAIKICESIYDFGHHTKFLNCNARRPCSLSFLRPVSRRGTVHPRSTFRISLAAKFFGRFQKVSGNETRLPGDKDM